MNGSTCNSVSLSSFQVTFEGRGLDVKLAVISPARPSTKPYSVTSSFGCGGTGLGRPKQQTLLVACCNNYEKRYKLTNDIEVGKSFLDIVLVEPGSGGDATEQLVVIASLKSVR